MGVRVGIVGVSGYGGSELLRLSVGHPAFEGFAVIQTVAPKSAAA